MTIGAAPDRAQVVDPATGLVSRIWLDYFATTAAAINGASTPASPSSAAGGPSTTTTTAVTVATTTVDAADLTGITLAPNVVNSSLTSVGTLLALTVSGPTVLSAIVSPLVPGITDTYDIGSPTKMWRSAYISQISAVLFAKQTQALYGGWLAVTKNAGTFAAPVAVADTAITFGQAMTLHQFVLVRATDAGGTITEEYLQVGALVAGTTYTVTRNLSGLGAKAWPIGTPYAVRGVAGDGWLELNAFDTPRMSIFSQGAAYNTSTETIRIGHLAGMPNAASGIGTYMGDATNYLLWDGTTFAVHAAGIALDQTGLFISPVSSVGGGAYANTNAVRWTTDVTYRTAIWRSDDTGGSPIKTWNFDHVESFANTVYAKTFHTTALVDISSNTGQSVFAQWAKTGQAAEAKLTAEGSAGNCGYLWLNGGSTPPDRTAVFGVGTPPTFSGSGHVPGTLTAGLSVQFSTADIIGNLTWTAYTPTLAVDTGTWVVGSGFLNCAYAKIGNLVVVRIDIENTTTTGLPTLLTFTLPVTAAGAYSAHLDTYFNSATWAGDGLFQVISASPSYVQLSRISGASFGAMVGCYIRQYFIYEH